MSIMLPRRTALASALGLLAGAAAAEEASFPARPIRLIYPFAPGVGDGLARSVAEAAREWLGQPIVVENKPGANTMIGAEAAARAPKDGYTLGWVATSTLALNPHFYPDIPYQPRDFAPLTLVYRAPVAFAAAADVPGEGFAGVLDYLRAHPGQPFGSVGNGSTPHLVMELLQSRTEVRMVNVAYRGEQAALSDLITGRIPFYAGSLNTLLPHREGRRFRVLALSAPERLGAAPEVPTFAELGHPDLVVRYWHGICAPAGTPPGVQRILAGALEKAVRSKLVQARATPDMALDPVSLGDFAAVITQDNDFYGRLIRERHISIT
ncbi:tripartite tricarboxylate transporter substrate binding protein [Roseomonas sp. E05]|uniref:tripartite tricarboxylate transporter substrate binding protein n=1 Tax=Roseomonas sp. E05 TaxID=3046310 RepID=UPI0024B975C1|nr:tripartite tricarboxylate transporter substrate binding protein [Roseomonas sp. E05]MDJ0390806.1 tripartite tricarboxylate transporter substrate binding protein [Roseomonas sp. E05]